MDSKDLEKQLRVVGARRAGAESKLKELDPKHGKAYRGLSADPDAAGEELKKIREEILYNQDLIKALDAEMAEIAGQIVDARSKNYKRLKTELDKDIARYYVEAGRHVSIGLAYLSALGAAPENAILGSLKANHPAIAEGFRIANGELKADPILNLVERKQVVEQIRNQLSGTMTRGYLIKKLVGPAIRASR